MPKDPNRVPRHFKSIGPIHDPLLVHLADSYAGPWPQVLKTVCILFAIFLVVRFMKWQSGEPFSWGREAAALAGWTTGLVILMAVAIAIRRKQRLAGRDTDSPSSDDRA